MTRPRTTQTRRGDLWLVDFGDPVGHEQGYRRPALVVSADQLNSSRAGVVIVLPLTTRRRRLPSHVEIRAGTGGIHTDSYAKCEDVKSVSVERLIHKLGHVDEGVVASAGRVLRLLLDLG